MINEINNFLYSPDSLNVSLFHAINSIQNPLLLDIAAFASVVLKFTFFPVYIFIIAFVARQQKISLKEVLTPVIMAYIIYIIWAAGLKHLLHMPRPFIRFPDSAIVRDTIKNAESPYASLPSGHAGFTMTMLVALWSRLNCIGKAILMFLVIYIGFARIELGMHLPSDIIMTWTIAIPAAYFSLKAARIYLEKSQYSHSK